MNKKTLTLRLKNTFNIGDFLSAKIYSDVKGNKCPCGGLFSERESIKKWVIPTCAKCRENPDKYRIIAKVIDVDGSERRTSIRHDQNGERLSDPIDCITTLKQINLELKEGRFDVRRYLSKEGRKIFCFSNFASVYLRHHEKNYRNGEIAKSSLMNKKVYIKHLNSYFAGIDIASIRRLHIENFKNEFKGTPYTINKSLKELKIMLNYAKSIELIKDLPDFGKLKPTKKRESVMDIKTAKRIAGHISCYPYRLIVELLLEYPVRPCDVRALKWEDVDFRKKLITFKSHFSSNEDTPGRKSRRPGQRYAKVELPLTRVAQEILRQLPRSINKDDYVFKGLRGGAVAENSLTRQWAMARKKAKLVKTKTKRYDMYEIKHARISDLMEKTNGNYIAVSDIAGIDVKTLMDRYNYSFQDLKAVLQ